MVRAYFINFAGIGLENFEFNPDSFKEVVLGFYNKYFKKFEVRSSQEDFQYKFIMLISNVIDSKISKRAGVTIRDFEVRRSINLLQECSKNFTKTKMQTALKAKYAAILFCTIKDLGWINKFVMVDQLADDLQQAVLDKSDLIFRQIKEKTYINFN